MGELAWEVLELSLTYVTSPDMDGLPLAIMRANGSVHASGVRRAYLVPHHYIIAPADGIWDFDFIMDYLQVCALGSVMSTANSSVGVIEVPDWCEGIRVHSSINAMEYRFDSGADPFGEGLPNWLDTAPIPEAINYRHRKLSILQTRRRLRPKKHQRIISNMIGAQQKLPEASPREVNRFQLSGLLIGISKANRRVIRHFRPIVNSIEFSVRY